MIPLTKDQAAKLSENKSLTIVRPLVQQPPEGYVYKGMLSGVVYFDYIGCVSHGIKLQFPVGKSVKCKEPQRIDAFGFKFFTARKVHSTTIAANRVCRVQEVPIAQWLACGLSVDLFTAYNYGARDHFNSLFAKPVLRTVDGKKQYVAWAWDIMSWWKMYVEDKNLSSLDESTLPLEICFWWKHLPLTVYCNPFVEIFKLNT